MNRKLNLGLSLAAGLLGGFLSQHIPAELVHAQTKTVPSPEIKAQRFELVNNDGSTAGFFGFDQDGKANVVLLDKTGKIVWSASGRANARPLNASAQQ